MDSEKKNKKEKSYSHLLPSVELDVCEENLGLFFQTMFERQQIWYKRFILKEERPWTKDKFFKNHKFTNVYRELDRNSQWQINNVFLVEKKRVELIWKILLFRIFNCPETFEWIRLQQKSFEGCMPSYYEYNRVEWAELIYGYRETGNNPYTNAYLINSQACPGRTRDYCYTQKVVPALHDAVPILNKLLLTAKTPEEIIKYLTTLPAVANFIAHEFYQDFTYAPKYSDVKLMKFDQNDFTNVGPGADVGIRLIFPSLTTNKQKVDAIYLLRDLAEEELSKFKESFKYTKWSLSKSEYVPTECNITLHQIEMWLCEFQKYWKMQVGLGKQRSVFQPKTK